MTICIIKAPEVEEFGNERSIKKSRWVQQYKRKKGYNGTKE